MCRVYSVWGVILTVVDTAEFFSTVMELQQVLSVWSNTTAAVCTTTVCLLFVCALAKSGTTVPRAAPTG